MNVEELAASCSDLERAELVATLRAGLHELQTTRPRNGSSYDPAPANTLISALTTPAGERTRSLFGRSVPRWMTIGALERDGCMVPAATLRRWCRTGAVPAVKAGRDWLVDRDELDRMERERNLK